MKKLLNVLSILIIIAASLQLYRVATFMVGAPDQTKRFADFPENQPQVVEFAVDPAAIARMEPQQQEEQLRDWLVFSIASVSGMSAEQLNRSLFDLFPIRYAYAAPVASFAYGETRSFVLDDGAVVALIPQNVSPEERADALYDIADEQRKNLGEQPATLLPFEYTLDADHGQAILTRRAPVSSSTLFGSESGYYQTTVGNADDLALFMKQVDDITFARLTEGGIELGGRVLRSHQMRRITVEDVVAIWQSEQKIQQQQTELNLRWQTSLHQLSPTCRAAVERTGSLDDATDLSAPCQSELQPILAKMQEEQRSLKLVDGSGFSLDPAYDYAGLANEFEQLTDWLYKIADSGYSPISRAEVDAARQGLAAKDELPFLKLIDTFKRSNEESDNRIANFLARTRLSFQYQAARYDGDLQGTEVGMVLFYTDLMAKLWGFDYQESAPAIDGFVPQTRANISPLYLQELQENPSTRLWFGPQHNGFQLAADGSSLLFARNATRLYAASSNDLNPGDEVAANTPDEMFLGWWNNHFEDVARVEPEYERLNAIMKWSLLIGWLNNQNAGERLDFLAAVPVTRDRWFPDWVKQHPELTFKEWDSIGFLPHGYLGTTTEAMSLLQSKVFSQAGIDSWTLTGGVSLGSRGVIDEVGVLSDDVPRLSRRSNLNYPSLSPGEDVLRTLDDVSYRFATPARNQAALTADPAVGARLRAADGDLVNMRFQRTISQHSNSLEFTTQVGDVPLGDLGVTRTNNGFRVGWRGRDVDEGQLLARRILESPSPELLLRNDSVVRTFVTLPDEGAYLVKMRSSDRWLKIVPESSPSAKIGEGFQARMALDAPDSQVLQLAWLDDGQFAAELRAGEQLVAQADTANPNVLSWNISARGPPTTAKPVRISVGQYQFGGQFDPQTGVLYLDPPTLPPGIAAPPDVTRLFNHTDIQELRRLAARGEPLSYNISPDRLDDVPDLLSQMRGRAARDVANDIAADPIMFGKQLKQSLDEGLSHVDLLLAHNEYEQGLTHIDELVAIHGRTPELQLRRGLAELGSGRVKTAVGTMNSLRVEKLHNSGRIFDEINARLSNSNVSQADRLSYSRTAEFFDWRADRIRRGLPEDQVQLIFAEDGQLSLGFRLSKLLQGDRVAALPKDALLYVQDSPTLNNLDWNVSLDSNIQQLISGDLGDVVMLPAGDIGRFKPTTIYAPDGKIFRVRGSSATSGVRVYQNYQPFSEQDDCLTQEQAANCEQPVYVVQARR